MMLVTIAGTGDAIDYTPGSAVAAGAVVVVGDLVGIALTNIAANQLGALQVSGLFRFPKESGTGTALTSGEEVFWDATNSRVDDVATVGKRVGLVVGAAGDDATSVLVRLVPGVTGALVGGLVSGQRMAAGSLALDGTNPTAVVTGLTTITSFVPALRGSTAPGVGTSQLTHAISGGTASVYAWKVTSTSDSTLVASTGTETFDWIAIGT